MRTHPDVHFYGRHGDGRPASVDDETMRGQAVTPVPIVRTEDQGSSGQVPDAALNAAARSSVGLDTFATERPRTASITDAMGSQDDGMATAPVAGALGGSATAPTEATTGTATTALRRRGGGPVRPRRKNPAPKRIPPGSRPLEVGVYPLWLGPTTTARGEPAHADGSSAFSPPRIEQPPSDTTSDGQRWTPSEHGDTDSRDDASGLPSPEPEALSLLCISPDPMWPGAIPVYVTSSPDVPTHAADACLLRQEETSAPQAARTGHGQLACPHGEDITNLRSRARTAAHGGSPVRGQLTPFAHRGSRRAAACATAATADYTAGPPLSHNVAPAVSVPGELPPLPPAVSPPHVLLFGEPPPLPPPPLPLVDVPRATVTGRQLQRSPPPVSHTFVMSLPMTPSSVAVQAKTSPPALAEQAATRLPDVSIPTPSPEHPTAASHASSLAPKPPAQPALDAGAPAPAAPAESAVKTEAPWPPPPAESAVNAGAPAPAALAEPAVNAGAPAPAAPAGPAVKTEAPAPTAPVELPTETEAPAPAPVAQPLVYTEAHPSPPAQHAVGTGPPWPPPPAQPAVETSASWPPPLAEPAFKTEAPSPPPPVKPVVKTGAPAPPAHPVIYTGAPCRASPMEPAVRTGAPALAPHPRVETGEAWPPPPTQPAVQARAAAPRQPGQPVIEAGTPWSSPSAEPPVCATVAVLVAATTPPAKPCRQWGAAAPSQANRGAVTTSRASPYSPLGTVSLGQGTFPIPPCPRAATVTTEARCDASTGVMLSFPPASTPQARPSDHGSGFVSWATAGVVGPSPSASAQMTTSEAKGTLPGRQLPVAPAMDLEPVPVGAAAAPHEAMDADASGAAISLSQDRCVCRCTCAAGRRTAKRR